MSMCSAKNIGCYQYFIVAAKLLFDYSSMTSNIILAPNLKLFWKIRQSVMV